MQWIEKLKLRRSGFTEDRRGVVTIEFALTVAVFILLLLFVAESVRLAYVSSVIDLAVSEAAKEAKNAHAELDGGYQNRFKKRLLTQGGALWGFLTNADAVNIETGYAGTINEMVASGGGAGTRFRPLARYKLSYRYSPMFFPFPKFWANNLMNREVIFVQEYERSKFMD